MAACLRPKVREKLRAQGQQADVSAPHVQLHSFPEPGFQGFRAAEMDAAPFAQFFGGVHDLPERLLHPGMGVLAQDTEILAHVIGTDQRRINAGHGQDFPDMINAGLGLDLADQHRFPV